MKKISIIVTVVILLSIGVGKIVYASEQETFREKAGVVPGSAFYKFDKAIEFIELNFTKNVEKKIKLIEKFNSERLAESEVLLEEHKVEDVKKLIEEISSNQEKLIVIISDMVEIDNLDLKKNTDKFIEGLEKVKEQLPIEAQEKINKVIEKQKIKVGLIESKKELKNKINIVKKEIKSLENEIKDAESQGKGITEIKSNLDSYKTSFSELEKEYCLLKEEKKTINYNKNRIDKTQNKENKEDKGETEYKEDKEGKEDKEDKEYKEYKDNDKNDKDIDNTENVKKVEKDKKQDKNNANKKEILSKLIMDKKKNELLKKDDKSGNKK